MTWLISWLDKEVKGIKVFYFIVVILLIDILYHAIFIFVSWPVTDYFPSGFSSVGDIKILTWYFPFFLFFAALGEEIIFRAIPLAYARLLFGKSDKVIYVAIVFSIIFGLCHGGVSNIFTQGVGGFLYCIVFLKCGGFQDEKIRISDDTVVIIEGPPMRKIVKATLCSTATHFLWNSVVALMILFFGGTTF